MAKLDKFVINGELGGESLTVVATIAVDSMDEAKAVIDGMGGSLGGAAAPAAKAAPAKRGGGRKAAPKVVEDPEESEEEEEDEEDEEDSDEESEEEEEDEEDEEEKPAKGKGGGGGLAIKATPELKNAGKLREVLTILVEQNGIKSKKQLLKACIALKEKVPCLARIADLESRVPQAASLIDPSIKD